jgi:hypothetical protein
MRISEWELLNHTLRLSLITGTALCIAMVGCKRKSGDGENCLRTDDCYANAKCLDGVCQSGASLKAKETAVKNAASEAENALNAKRMAIAKARAPMAGEYCYMGSVFSPCETRGECEIRLPYHIGHCFVSTAKQPKCASDCANRGHCTPRGGLCVATSDEDCLRSRACKTSGHCHVLDGSCRATVDSDCRNTTVCKEYGFCSVLLRPMTDDGEYKFFNQAERRTPYANRHGSCRNRDSADCRARRDCRVDKYNCCHHDIVHGWKLGPVQGVCGPC